tara:strand:- start:4361 stop:4846 length:486 start_codon:yes stop_codon:yes gene_type:complete
MAFEKINAEVVKGADGSFNTIDVIFKYDEPRSDKFGNQDWGVQDEKLLRCSTTLMVALESLGVREGSKIQLSKCTVETKNGIIHPWVVNGKPASEYKISDAHFSNNAPQVTSPGNAFGGDFLQTVMVQLQSALDTLKAHQQVVKAPQAETPKVVEEEDLPF